VGFTNTSTGNYSTALWNFGDGITSTIFSPNHIYSLSGFYTVTLTVSGSGGTDILTQTNAITVSTDFFHLLFRDNFDLGADPIWTNHAGIWNAQQGEYRQTNLQASDAFSWVRDRTCQESSASVRMKLNSSPGTDSMAYASGLVLRFQDIQNLYLADLTAVANQARIYRRNNNVWTQLAAVPFSVQKDNWYDVQFTAMGSQLTLIVNGIPTAQAVDSTLTRGLAGLRSDNSLVSFDNYQLLCYDPRNQTFLPLTLNQIAP
jgi:PKD repeat protein